MRDFQPWPTGGAVHPRAASVERPGSAAALLPASARLSLGAGLGPAARRKRKWPRPQGGGARRGAELPGAAPRRRLPRRAAAPRAARHKLSAGRRGRVAARRCPGTSLSRSREGGGWVGGERPPSAAGGHGRQPEEEEEEALSVGPAVSARRASFSTAALRFARRLSQVPPRSRPARRANLARGAGGGGPGPIGGCHWAGSARQSGESGSGARTRLEPLAPEVRSGARAGRRARLRRGCSRLAPGEARPPSRPLPERISVCAALVNRCSEGCRPLRSCRLPRGRCGARPRWPLGPGRRRVRPAAPSCQAVRRPPPRAPPGLSAAGALAATGGGFAENRFQPARFFASSRRRGEAEPGKEEESSEGSRGGCPPGPARRGAAPLVTCRAPGSGGTATGHRVASWGL